MSVVLQAEGLSKDFTLHLQGAIRLRVLSDVNLVLRRGECVALHGPSGAGKSTLMRSLYANYLATSGRILVQHAGEMVDITKSDPRTVLAIRRRTLGYVSQFLRVVPRVSALAIVEEAVAARGGAQNHDEARSLLRRLNMPDRLHGLPPATFSGGEQQRVNLARGFAGQHSILLLDEPTASLDDVNRDVVVNLINEVKSTGTAVLGIFHDAHVRSAVADRLFNMV